MEKNERVYICDVDYLYTKEAEEFEKFTGGAVYIFVRAFDVRKAVVLLEQDMKLRNIEAREVVSISPYNIEQEWTNQEEQTHYLHLYIECEKVNPIVYDDFMAYERE